MSAFLDLAPGNRKFIFYSTLLGQQLQPAPVSFYAHAPATNSAPVAVCLYRYWISDGWSYNWYACSEAPGQQCWTESGSDTVDSSQYYTLSYSSTYGLYICHFQAERQGYMTGEVLPPYEDTDQMFTAMKDHLYDVRPTSRTIPVRWNNVYDPARTLSASFTVTVNEPGSGYEGDYSGSGGGEFSGGGGGF